MLRKVKVKLPTLIVERRGRGQVTASMVMNPVVGCHHLPPGPQRHTHAYHKPGGRLPLFSARPAVTFPAIRHPVSYTHLTLPTKRIV